MRAPRAGTLKRQIYDDLRGNGVEPTEAAIAAVAATVKAVAVNGALTKKPARCRRRYTDTADFGNMVVRMIRAYGKRCESADMDDLRRLIQMQDDVADTIRTTIAHLKTEQEFSWSAIAEATGTTRQGAQQRWGRSK